MEREVFICACNSLEHQIVFTHFDDDQLVYLDVHLNRYNFFHRLRYGLKYIFGYRCKYGAFDEFILDPQDVGKLERIVEIMKKGSEQ